MRLWNFEFKVQSFCDNCTSSLQLEKKSSMHVLGGGFRTMKAQALTVVQASRSCVLHKITRDRGLKRSESTDMVITLICSQDL